MSEIKHIGKYEVRREIGRGGMGVVFEGFDADIQRRVAIKTLHSHIIHEDNAADLERFRREARAAAACTHPNVVQVLEFGQSDGVPFIAMDFVEGQSLEQAMRERSDFGLRAVFKVFSQLLSALRAIHALGIVHRDVKPANLLVDRQWAAKLTDFGIARVDDSALTKVGSIVGTPLYMPPEQAMALELDHRADLFAATVVLHEMLANAHIPSGVPCKPLDPIPGLPSTLRIDLTAPVPNVLIKVLERGLNPNRKLRHNDVNELARDLKRALVNLKVGPNDSVPAAPRASAEPPTTDLAETRITSTESAELTVISRSLSDAHMTAVTSGLASAIDESLLTELKESLSKHCKGNITEMVNRHAENAISVAELVHLLADEIDKPKKRQQFLDHWSL